MSTFNEDLQEAREAEKNEADLDQTIKNLQYIGNESRRARTLPERRAEVVRYALQYHDRATLPVPRIAELVDLHRERVYQIERESRAREQEIEDDERYAHQREAR